MARNATSNTEWVLATLGNLPFDRVQAALRRDSLMEKIMPLLVLGGNENWLAGRAIGSNFDFLLMQNL